MNSKEVIIPMQVQKERIIAGGIIMSQEEFRAYCSAPDVLASGDIVPPGYKRCGRCRQIKKFHMFNQNRSSLTNCTGNCKDCQKTAARASYDKNKDTKDYKEHYQKNKEKKLAANRKYYAANREERILKHKEYLASTKGKRVMKKAHNKRKAAMSLNAGIPWTRTLVVDRDSVASLSLKGSANLPSMAEIREEKRQTYPTCILCGKPIEVDKDIQMEHLIPIVLGGADCFTNVGCAHTLCNLRKSKDAKEIEVEQVEDLMKRSMHYMEAYPEAFPKYFESGKENTPDQS